MCLLLLYSYIHWWASPLVRVRPHPKYILEKMVRSSLENYVFPLYWSLPLLEKKNEQKKRQALGKTMVMLGPPGLQSVSLPTTHVYFPQYKNYAQKCTAVHNTKSCFLTALHKFFQWRRQEFFYEWPIVWPHLINDNWYDILYIHT